MRCLLEHTQNSVVNLDKLTYAGNLNNLADVASDPRYLFELGDTCDAGLLSKLFITHKPDAVIHMAAESHVDRSILTPAAFVETNIIGTFQLLEAARTYWNTLTGTSRANFRFLHVSSDEVYGSADSRDLPFTEASRYNPSSPYSSSKASSDHLVKAWSHTYGIPTLITNGANTYGPRQYPEKLIPHTIIQAMRGNALPVYGDGLQVREWLHVDDHAQALICVLMKGQEGHSYNIGGESEQHNINVVKLICKIMGRIAPEQYDNCSELIAHVQDRPGHDKRYAIDDRKIRETLGWAPAVSFEAGLEATIRWYMSNSI